jgi:hypothetical protein
VQAPESANAATSSAAPQPRGPHSDRTLAKDLALVLDIAPTVVLAARTLASCTLSDADNRVADELLELLDAGATPHCLQVMFGVEKLSDEQQHFADRIAAQLGSASLLPFPRRCCMTPSSQRRRT